MKNYLNYLKNSPVKLLWLCGVSLFCITCVLYLTKGIESTIDDIGYVFYYGIMLFLLTILIVSNYQTYKEYKDGL